MCATWYNPVLDPYTCVCYLVQYNNYNFKDKHVLMRYSNLVPRPLSLSSFVVNDQKLVTVGRSGNE